MVSKAIQYILDSPASLPPDGTDANLDNPDSHNNGPLALVIVCVVLTVVAAAARIYSRIYEVKKDRLEDFLGLLALASYIAAVYSYLRFLVNVGFFVHTWDMPGSALVETTYDAFLMTTVYYFMLLCAKTAILLDWERLFAPTAPGFAFRGGSRGLIILNVLLYGAALITLFTVCEPLGRFWKSYGAGFCMDRKARNIGFASVNVVQNVAMILLPQMVIWKRPMTAARRLGISVGLMLGLLLLVTSVGHLAAILALDFPSRYPDAGDDAAYQFSVEFQWCIAEATCVMLVFCLQALPKGISERAVLLTGRVAGVFATDNMHNVKTASCEQVSPQALDGPVPEERVIDDEEEWSRVKRTQTSTVELGGVPDSHSKENR